MQKHNMPVVLYGCETWSLMSRERYRLRVFENRVLRKTSMVIMSRKLKWVAEVTRPGVEKCKERILFRTVKLIQIFYVQNKN